MIAHAVGAAFAATAFVLFLVTDGSDKVGNGLYLVMLAWLFGAAAATGRLSGVVATMALALVAMARDVSAAALATGVRLILRSCSRRGCWRLFLRLPL